MRKLISALLYTALLGVANIAHADIAELEALRKGDMRKLIFHSEPWEGSSTAFTHEDGSEMTLAEFEGQVVVLNFWATWCAPCRKEMPHLSALQSEMGGDDLQVVTVATGRNARPAMERFLEEIGVDNLPLHTDNRSSLARSMGVLGLPATIILDREGNELGRMQGEADWSSDNATAILSRIVDGQY
ncbi:TlpA disulfide reductase family protein [Yoonia litorea]|uniref:Thiol-disulfide isomerase or thioredoxin n=1 Tax=Yoonia litorea TaxID=1123755 RepID=A0A1I6L3B1_9RHOB|nr:TlpA family protein disulfide reductase [Yoonia litorea]SFR97983.1 Thiol-disulfide isomerase or thioredoxin [Yoonia litorea]